MAALLTMAKDKTLAWPTPGLRVCGFSGWPSSSGDPPLSGPPDTPESGGTLRRRAARPGKRPDPTEAQSRPSHVRMSRRPEGGGAKAPALLKAQPRAPSFSRRRRQYAHVAGRVASTLCLDIYHFHQHRCSWVPSMSMINDMSGIRVAGSGSGLECRTR